MDGARSRAEMRKEPSYPANLPSLTSIYSHLSSVIRNTPAAADDAPDFAARPLDALHVSNHSLIPGIRHSYLLVRPSVYGIQYLQKTAKPRVPQGLLFRKRWLPPNLLLLVARGETTLL